MKKLMSLFLVCIAIFSMTFTALAGWQGNNYVDSDGNTYYGKSANAASAGDVTGSAIGGGGKANVFFSPDDARAIKDDLQKNSKSSTADKTFAEISEGAKNDLNDISDLVNKFSPNYSEGGTWIFNNFGDPIRFVLGVIFFLGWLFFGLVLVYNGYLVVVDGAYEQTGSGSTDTGSGTASILAFANKFVSKSTKDALQKENGKFSFWILRQLGAIGFLALMAFLLFSGLFFKIITFFANMIGG